MEFFFTTLFKFFDCGWNGGYPPQQLFFISYNEHNNPRYKPAFRTAVYKNFVTRIGETHTNWQIKDN